MSQTAISFEELIEKRSEVYCDLIKSLKEKLLPVVKASSGAYLSAEENVLLINLVMLGIKKITLGIESEIVPDYCKDNIEELAVFEHVRNKTVLKGL
jgi:hypothetical protein